MNAAEKPETPCSDVKLQFFPLHEVGWLWTDLELLRIIHARWKLHVRKRRPTQTPSASLITGSLFRLKENSFFRFGLLVQAALFAKKPHLIN